MKKDKCNCKEWIKKNEHKFCKKCGDISTRELCSAPGCMRFNKPKHSICIESNN